MMHVGVCRILGLAALLAGPGIGFGQDAAAAPEQPRAVVPVAPEQEQARKREADSTEDPLKKRQAEKVDQPDEWSDEPSGYDVYGSLRLRYSIKAFQRLLFLEARFDKSRETDGTQVGDSVTLGVRWNFDRRGRSPVL